MKSTVTSKGQITIPKRVREVLRLEAGDKIDFRIEPDGSVWMYPIAKKVNEVFGAFAYKTEGARSIDEMKQGVAEALKKRNP